MEGTNLLLGPGPDQEGDNGVHSMDNPDPENGVIDLRITNIGAPAVSHNDAVQALRKYLLRKMSSEGKSHLNITESSGEKELESATEKVISVAESNGSKLYFSLVQRPKEAIENSWTRTHQGTKTKCLAKHKSLDLDDSSSTFEHGIRYLRTDLCIPVLHSKCSFCDDFFENEEQLRKHLRDSHFQYFLNYIQMRPLTSTKSLSDLPFSSALQISSSDSGQSSSSSVNRFENNGWGDAGTTGNVSYADNFALGGKYYGRKPVKCDICGKCFTTKWNCKQHQKGHAKETVPAVMMMDTSSASGGELSPPLPTSSTSSSLGSFP